MSPKKAAKAAAEGGEAEAVESTSAAAAAALQMKLLSFAQLNDDDADKEDEDRVLQFPIFSISLMRRNVVVSITPRDDHSSCIVSFSRKWTSDLGRFSTNDKKKKNGRAAHGVALRISRRHGTHHTVPLVSISLSYSLAPFLSPPVTVLWCSRALSCAISLFPAYQEALSCTTSFLFHRHRLRVDDQSYHMRPRHPVMHSHTITCGMKMIM